MLTIDQCPSCPWRTDCNPDTDIPNGYSRTLHESLRRTVVSGYHPDRPFRIMACHYSKTSDELPCAGWLHHQITVGNNIQARIAVSRGRLPMPVVCGPQHSSFDETLPMKLTPSHIRTPANDDTLCGSNGGSVSLTHYIEQPTHVASLHMCETCAEIERDLRRRFDFDRESAIDDLKC